MMAACVQQLFLMSEVEFINRFGTNQKEKTYLIIYIVRGDLPISPTNIVRGDLPIAKQIYTEIVNTIYC